MKTRFAAAASPSLAWRSPRRRRQPAPPPSCSRASRASPSRVAPTSSRTSSAGPRRRRSRSCATGTRRCSRSGSSPARLGVPTITFEGLVEGTSEQGPQARARLVDLRQRAAHDVRRARHADARSAPHDPPPGSVGVRRAVARRSQALRPALPAGRERRHPVRRPLGQPAYGASSSPGRSSTGREPSERMNGIALARAWSRDGTWAYTLYNGGTSHAFVHALDTRARRRALHRPAVVGRRPEHPRRCPARRRRERDAEADELRREHARARSTRARSR